MFGKNVRFGLLAFLMFLDISVSIWAIHISDGAIFEANPIINYLWGTFGLIFGTILVLINNIAILVFFTYAELIPESDIRIWKLIIHKRRPAWPTSSEFSFVIILIGYGIIFYQHIMNLLAIRQYGLI